MGDEQTRILQGDNCPDIVLNSGGPWFQQHLPEIFRKNSWASLKSPKVSSVPKMEGFLNLIRLIRRFLGVGKLPHRSRIHTAYIGEDSSILGTWNVGWWKVSEIFLCPSLGEVLLHLPGEVSSKHSKVDPSESFNLFSWCLSQTAIFLLGRNRLPILNFVDVLQIFQNQSCFNLFVSPYAEKHMKTIITNNMLHLWYIYLDLPWKWWISHCHASLPQGNSLSPQFCSQRMCWSPKHHIFHVRPAKVMVCPISYHWHVQIWAPKPVTKWSEPGVSISIYK